jgi:hypothetical protein
MKNTVTLARAEVTSAGVYLWIGELKVNTWLGVMYAPQVRLMAELTNAMIARVISEALLEQSTQYTNQLRELCALARTKPAGDAAPLQPDPRNNFVTQIVEDCEALRAENLHLMQAAYKFICSVHNGQGPDFAERLTEFAGEICGPAEH